MSSYLSTLWESTSWGEAFRLTRCGDDLAVQKYCDKTYEWVEVTSLAECLRAFEECAEQAEREKGELEEKLGSVRELLGGIDL